MKFLHEHPAPHGVKIYSLDHRLCPEVRAMFCAMASRMPAGGIATRYAEVIEKVAAAGFGDRGVSWWGTLLASQNPVDVQYVRSLMDAAEDLLTQYPLHPVVKGFMDTFVGQYGHASIMELTGEPAIFVEGVSWWTAWLSFDGPLVKGQEFSTRAKTYKDWPMCAEVYRREGGSPLYGMGNPGLAPIGKTPTYHQAHQDLASLHLDWLEVFAHEVDWWTEHLQSAENRAALGIADKEPFRPAYDRARWALPGTISTGFAHTANIRDQSRVNRTARDLADLCSADGGSAVPGEIWRAVEAAYAAAVPGFSGYSFKAAVGQDEVNRKKVPGHLMHWYSYWGDGDSREVEHILQESGTDVYLSSTHKWGFEPYGMGAAYVREGGHAGGYLDPAWNRLHYAVGIRCSLAVARDWHRHRTLMPWTLRPLMRRKPDMPPERGLALHPAYEAKSAFAKERVSDLLKRSEDTYRDLFQHGDHYRAILALPLGAECLLLGYGGLRDIVYMAELRANAHGANFEYKAQAEELLRQLREKDINLKYTGDL